MTTPVDSSSHPFANYRGVVGNPPVAAETWATDTTLEVTVVAALEGVARLLSGPSVSALATVLDGLFQYSGAITFRGLRVSLLGSTSVGDEQRARIVNELVRESLCVVVLPSVSDDILPSTETSAPQMAAGAIPLYRADIDALALDRITFGDLLEYKLFRRFVLDKPDAETQYDSRLYEQFNAVRKESSSRPVQVLDDVLAEAHAELSTWIDHPLAHRIRGEVLAGRGCLLVGPSSSGKTILAFEVGRSLQQDGRRVHYGTLDATGQDIAAFLWSTVESGASAGASILLLDDLQSSPIGARYVLSLAHLFQRAAIGNVSAIIVGVTWPGFAQEASRWHEDALPILVRAQQIRPVLLRRFAGSLPGDAIREIGERFGDDLALLRLSLERGQQVGGPPTEGDVAEAIWLARTGVRPEDDRAAMRVAMVAGTLGRYDFTVTPSFLAVEAHVQPEVVSRLVECGLLRRQRASLTLGHRSLCALLADWLAGLGSWAELRALGGPAGVTAAVLDFLRGLDSSLTVDTMRALQTRAGFRSGAHVSARAAALIEVWKAFNDVLERIEHQQSIDATWGGTPSSAMFAIQALSFVGKHAQTTASLAFLRQHWTMNSGRMTVRSDDLATAYDFVQIRDRVAREDAELGSSRPPHWQSAGELDIDRLHQSWLRGVFLCAEAASIAPQLALATLSRAVEAEQLPSGAFYPERVPWCTARILLGLAACGRTIETSEAVARAAAWLSRDINSGGAYRDGVFPSGTGDWNSELETTAMVLMALAAVGVDCSGQSIYPARSYLVSMRNQWTAANCELDGTVALNAYLETGGDWDNVANDAQKLSRWARGEAFWRSATRPARDSLRQSCRVAQISSHLVSIGWAAIRSDLPAFLDALAVPDMRQVPIAPIAAVGAGSAPTHATPSGAGENDEARLVVRLLGIPRISLRECTVVGAYRRYEERVRNQLRDWCRRMSLPFVDSSGARENYLIWAPPGSGKSFLIQQLAAQLAPAVRYLEVNLVQKSREEFVTGLRTVGDNSGPTLCLIDEVDGRSDEAWPYGELLGLLDQNLRATQPVVVVLVGSSGAGLNAMVRGIERRDKGVDLIDRIPVASRFEIPPLTPEDRLVVVASQVVDAAKKRGHSIAEIERLALFYSLVTPEIQTARQLRELAVAAVQRVGSSEQKLRYDDLFAKGDRRNQQFWTRHQDAAEALGDLFAAIEE